MDAELSFFRSDGDGLMPTEVALSSWGRQQLHGVAISGALARAAEHAVTALGRPERGRSELVPTRHTVDLFRPALLERCELVANVVREGPRLCLVDVVMSQGGQPVARASTLWLTPTESTPGRVWQPGSRPEPPSHDVAPPTQEPRVPFLHSEAGWSQTFGDHQNDSRKTTWSSAVPVVAGEPPTPFEAVAASADGVNMVTSWGTRGVEHINSDITLTLVRRPVGTEVGLQATDRVECDGLVVGTAAVFDREGPLGTVVMTGLANQQRSIDLGAIDFDDDGGRRVASEV